MPNFRIVFCSEVLGISGLKMELSWYQKITLRCLLRTTVLALWSKVLKRLMLGPTSALWLIHMGRRHAQHCSMWNVRIQIFSEDHLQVTLRMAASQEIAPNIDSLVNLKTLSIWWAESGRFFTKCICILLFSSSQKLSTNVFNIITSYSIVWKFPTMRPTGHWQIPNMALHGIWVGEPWPRESNGKLLQVNDISHQHYCLVLGDQHYCLVHRDQHWALCLFECRANLNLFT